MTPLPLCLAGEAIVEGGSRGVSGGLAARAYEGGTGRLLWQADRQPSDGGIRTLDLLCQEGRVFSVGLGFESGQPRHFVLTMMRASDGRVQWEKSFEAADSWLSPALLTAGSQGVFATSTECSSSVCRTVIFALDAATGGLMWRRELGGEAGWTRVSGISAVGGQLLTVGAEPTAQGPEIGFVRSLDPCTGRLRWEDLSVTPHMVAARAGLAFVGGFVELDQVLRAYRIAMSEPGDAP
jgi:outer membrane protein assembly factor BamB